MSLRSQFQLFRANTQPRHCWVLFLMFEELSIIYTPSYPPANSVQELQFLHSLPSTHRLSFLSQPPDRRRVNRESVG